MSFLGPQKRAARLIANTLSTLAITLLLAACARDTSDLDRHIAEVKSRPSAPIEPIPEMKPFESFAYPDDVARDPFAPLDFMPKMETSKNTGPRPDMDRPREILEDYPLDTLQMMGTLQQKNDLWALIRDPSGTIHRVQPGNHMGQNHGRITGISDEAVTVRELVPDNAGGWIERQAALAAKE